MAYTRIARVVSEGTPGTTRVELENGDILLNVQTVRWEIAGKDNYAQVTLELDGVDIQVNDNVGDSYKRASETMKVEVPS